MKPRINAGRVVGWVLFVPCVVLAFTEPHRGQNLLAVAAAILIAGESIADAISTKPA